MHGTPIVTADGGQVALSELVRQIKTEHQLATEAATRAIGHAINAGRGLNVAKTKLRHGEWQHFLRKCDVPLRTAQRYMQLAKLVEIKNVATTHLDGCSIEGAIKKLSPPKLAAASKPIANKVVVPAADIANSLQWSTKTIDERRRFIDAIGLKSLLEAIPPSWAPALERHFTATPPKPKSSTAELPADLSIPPSLRRVA